MVVWLVPGMGTCAPPESHLNKPESHYGTISPGTDVPFFDYKFVLQSGVVLIAWDAEVGVEGV